MNLENLKSEWSAMNDRMEKREIFEEKMFCQMLNTKSDKSLGRLVAYEVIGLIVCVLFIPVLFYIHKVSFVASEIFKENAKQVNIAGIGQLNDTAMEFLRILVICAIVILVICVIWQGIKIFILSKIDFAKTLKNNLLYINKYAIYIKYEKLANCFLIPLLVSVCVFHYAKMHVSLFWWLFMSCTLIAMILFVIYLYRLYNKNISTIQQNLEELRELEEK